MHIFDRMENREMVALGWTLLHFCWQGTLLAILYAVVDRVAVRSATRVRYAIALLTVALMPIIAIATFIEQQRLVAPTIDYGRIFTASQLGSMHTTVVTQMKFAPPLVEQSELWIAWNADRLLPWIDGLWLGGVLLLALRSFGGWLSLERIRRTAESSVPPEVELTFRRIMQRLKVGHSVALYISERVVSPLAMVSCARPSSSQRLLQRALQLISSKPSLPMNWRICAAGTISAISCRSLLNACSSSILQCGGSAGAPVTCVRSAAMKSQRRPVSILLSMQKLFCALKNSESTDRNLRLPFTAAQARF